MTTSTLTAPTITSLWMTFGTCVHAQRELVCTANIFTVRCWSHTRASPWCWPRASALSCCCPCTRTWCWSRAGLGLDVGHEPGLLLDVGQISVTCQNMMIFSPQTNVYFADSHQTRVTKSWDPIKSCSLKSLIVCNQTYFLSDLYIPSQTQAFQTRM